MALVFGNEKYGLTAAEVGKCQLLATIPAESRSTPRSTWRRRSRYSPTSCASPRSGRARAVSGKPPAQATHEEIERFYEHLERSLLEAGFLNPRNPKKLMARLRRLFGRAQLEQEEVNILRGVIKTLVQPKKRERAAGHRTLLRASRAWVNS